MDNHTELENKLFGYIRFLIGLLNTQEQFINYLYSGYSYAADWAGKAFVEQDRANGMQKMIEDLNREFGWDAKMISASPKEDQDASVGTDQ